MRVIVTGGHGFIGRATVRALEAAGHEVHAVRHQHFGDAATLERAFDRVRPQGAIHAAWVSGPNRIADGEGNARSGEDSLRVINALRKAGCARVVVVGSGVEVQRDTAVGQSPYVMAKRAVHDRLIDLCAPGFGTLCAHVFGVTGPGEPEWRIVPRIIRAVLAGESIDVSTGTQRRDILHVSDVARALVTLLDSDETGSADVCAGAARPLRDLFEAVENAVGVRDLVRYGAADLAAADLHEAAGSAERLRGLGWHPDYTWETAAADAVAWWREELCRS